MALETRSIEGVELLAVGTWQGGGCPDGGCKFTTKDLDNAVAAWEATSSDLRPPVKLGHDDNQKLLQADGYPAAGWVTNLRRIGKKLVGDLENVPKRVAELIAAGAYRTRSVELQRDYEVGGKDWPLVLTGVALLGADLPAVESLKDIAKLYQSLQLTYEESDGARYVVFAEAAPTDDMATLTDELDGLVSRMELVMKGQRGSPAARMKIREVRSHLANLVRAAKAANMTKEEQMALDEQALRTELGLDGDADIIAAVKALKEKGPDPKPDPDPPTPDPEKAELSQKLNDAEKRIITLEQQSARASAERSVDELISGGRLLPKQREMAVTMALRMDETEFKSYVETLPTSVITLGEQGTSDAPDLAGLEPTEAELAVAKQAGTSRESLMRQKARDKGIELPADFGKEKE